MYVIIKNSYLKPINVKKDMFTDVYRIVLFIEDLNTIVFW